MEIKNLKFNISIDLIRKKIIEKDLNSKKNSLLEKPSKLDLIYNYNTQYIIINDSLSNLCSLCLVDMANINVDFC